MFRLSQPSHRTLLLTGSLLAGIASPGIALAQDNTTTDQTPEITDEIIVSATKRAETIQDVPVSVAAIDTETIRENGIIDIADVSLYIPNFEFSDASILPNLYIRGIGSGTTHSVEQSVGRFIDDVYIGRAAINLHSLLDIASVEVLRGPQGTLFGKNTLAGAVIINTADPTTTFDAGVNLFASDYSTVGGQIGGDAFISGPLSDNLSARLAVQYKDRDGYIDNRAPGPDGGTRQDYGGRLKFLWDNGSNTTIALKLEYLRYEEEGQTPAETTFSFFPGGPAAGQQIPESIFQIFAPEFSYERNWQSFIDCSRPHNGVTFCPGRDQETGNITFNVSHDWAGKGTFDFITGYQSVEYLHEFVAVEMGVAGGAARFTRDEEYSGFTQEIRFTSEEFEKYDFILGAYYENSDVERLQPSTFNVPEFLFFFPPGAPLPFETDREDWRQSTETYAAFGQVRWRFADQWSLILGGRLATETKDYRLEQRLVEFQGDAFNGPFLENFDFQDSRSETEFTPSGTLRWEPNPDVMVYASIAQGHKTGGFSDRPQVELEFDAETNTSYEAGVKATLFGGDLSVNIAAFYMDVQDLQVASAIPTAGDLSFEVKNAAEAVSQGIEFDAVWRLSDNWTVGGDFAFTDAEYEDFPDASATCPVSGGTVQPDGLCNFAGLPLIFAPDWKAGAFVEFEQIDLFGGWDFKARGNVNYSDSYFTELNYRETLAQDSYALLGASMTFTAPNDKLTVGLVGRNLTEKHVIAWGLQAGFTDFVTPNAPRELMVRLGYRY